MDTLNKKQLILSEIQRCVTEGGLSYIESAVHVAETLNIDVEVVGRAVKSCPQTRQLVHDEGMSLNILTKHEAV